MTATLQSSIRLDDGTIHVVGGNGFDDFYQNLLGVYGGDQAKVTDHIHRLGLAFIPGANEFAASQQAVGVVQGAIPGAQVVSQQPQASQQYAPPAPAAAQYQQPQQGYAAPPQQYPTPAPRQPQAAPPGAAPICVHGPRNHKTGTYKQGAKAGQAYAMWKCPAPQGQDCSPIWL